MSVINRGGAKRAAKRTNASIEVFESAHLPRLLSTVRRQIKLNTMADSQPMKPEWCSGNTPGHAEPPFPRMMEGEDAIGIRESSVQIRVWVAFFLSLFFSFPSLPVLSRFFFSFFSHLLLLGRPALYTRLPYPTPYPASIPRVSETPSLFDQLHEIFIPSL